MSDDDNWFGINQTLSSQNRQWLFREHKMDEIIADYDDVQKEVKLGISKLDFKIGGTYSR